MDRQSKMPIVEALSDYKKNSKISLHIPGHSDGNGTSELFLSLVGEDVMRCDATEVKGLDDYHKAAGVIAESQQLAAELWGSDEALFLVNGTTSGIMAAIYALTNSGDEILVQRNSHLAVTRGLTLSGAHPIYFTPEVCSAAGIPGSVNPLEIKKILSNKNSIKAVYITDPSYYGVVSDLKSIINIAHEFDIPVIIDEAHGGHMYFCDVSETRAVTAGADVVIQSLHKTVGSMTQSSIIHMSGNLVDMKKMTESVKMMQSTSPSYILMASLDAARYNMAHRGKRIFSDRVKWCDSFRKCIKDIPGIECLFYVDECAENVFSFDRLRLSVTAEGCGLSGIRLSEILESDYSIVTEFSDFRYVVAVVGPGTPEESVRLFSDALSDISKRFFHDITSESVNCVMPEPELPVVVYSPAEARNYDSILATWDECAGCIASVEITPYPPGIPLLMKGELISEEMRDYIKSIADEGIEVHGLEKRGGEWHSYILDTAR